MTTPHFKPGIYRHYKGHYYRALFLAQDSTNRPIVIDGATAFESTEDPMVVYVSLDDPHKGNLCVRPLAQWNEDVEIAGVVAPRFQYLPYGIPE